MKPEEFEKLLCAAARESTAPEPSERWVENVMRAAVHSSAGETGTRMQLGGWASCSVALACVVLFAGSYLNQDTRWEEDELLPPEEYEEISLL
jgi:hypothetical protein